MDNSDDEGFSVPSQVNKVSSSETPMAFFFNIQSLFQDSDRTLTPEQFLDNAKNPSQKWSSKHDNKLLKAFQRYENNWLKVQDEMKITKRTAEECKDRLERLQNSSKGTWTA